MTAARDLSHFVRHLDGGVARMELEVDGVLRPGCTQAIEGDLAAIPDTTLAQVNMADRRVAVEWRDGKVDPVRFIRRLSELGYQVHPCGAIDAASAVAPPSPWMLLRRLGVAALAALAIELLPVVLSPDSSAATAAGQGDLIRWLSVIIALPAAAWAGGPFFVAAARALAAGRVSRETPVSIGIGLTLALSVCETLSSGAEASCDSGLVLLAVALAARILEPGLLSSDPAGGGSPPHDDEAVTKFVTDTELAEVSAGLVRPGDLILVRPGERIKVDGVVIEGRSTIDQSRATGETLPVSVARDGAVYAGTLNLSGALRVRAGVAEAAALPDTAGRAARSFFDRAVELFPLGALALALMTFLGRTAFGAGWHDAATAAIALLVMAHPATLSLAVSAVRTRAARALSRAGVLLRSGAAVERLANVDTILFDKTGTLTLPEAEVVNAADIPPSRLALAGRLALTSRHPLAGAVARAADARFPMIALEEPGQGVRGLFHGIPVRLGRPSFCDAERRAAAVLETDPEASVIAFSYGAERHVLAVRQRLRADAIEAITQLKQRGFAVEIVSGDRAPAVDHAARTLGIEDWNAGMTAADKSGHIAVLQAQGRTVLMVGDGLNDAPALAAADAAFVVGTAAPSALASADGILASERLAPVAAAIAMARNARRLRRQNIWFAAACTAAVAFAAITGAASPLTAALVMSGATVLVALNACRAGGTHAVPAPQKR